MQRFLLWYNTNRNRPNTVTDPTPTVTDPTPTVTDPTPIVADPRSSRLDNSTYQAVGWKWSFNEAPNGGPKTHYTADDYSIWEWICLVIGAGFVLQGFLHSLVDTYTLMKIIPKNLDENIFRFFLA